ERRPALPDGPEERDPVEELAAHVARCADPLVGRFREQLARLASLKPARDLCGPRRVRAARELRPRRFAPTDVEAEASAREHGDACRLAPRGDRVAHELAEREAPARGRERRRDAGDEQRDDRYPHRRCKEVERHEDRVVDRELLREREVEAGGDAAIADVRGEALGDRDVVTRKRGRAVVRTGRAIGDADREEWQVVEEERVHVVRREDDERVGAHRLELRRDLSEARRDGGSSPTAALLSDQVQALQISVEAMSAGVEGGDIVYVAAPVSSPLFWFVALPTVNGPADLKGKKIGATAIGSATYFADVLALQ